MGVGVSILIGLGLFIMLTWWTHLKASKTVRKITAGKITKIQKKDLSDLAPKEIHVRVKTRSQIKTYLHKDLSAATHDLKTLLAIIMPIILSCIFTFSFTVGNIGSAVLLERDLLFNWVGMLIFNPVISSMLVYGLLNTERSGISILASLPLNPRKQANAKLIILLTLQTLAVFAPLLIYIGTDKFLILFFAILTSLPITWIFLILTFELRILFFSKYKDHYVIDEVHSEKRIYKWFLIVCIQYILSFWIMSFLIIFFSFQQLSYLAIFIVFVSIVGFPTVIFLFYKMFPVLPPFKAIPRIISKYELEARPTTLSKHSWLSIVVIIILYLSFQYLLILLFDLLFHDYWFFPFWDVSYFFYFFSFSASFEISKLFGIFSSTLIFILIFIIGVPKVLGLPYGKLPVKLYLESIKAKWVEKAFKYFIGGLLLIILFYLVSSFIGLTLFSINYQPYIISLVIFQIFCQEFIFRGLILTILLKNRRKKKAILLNAFIYTFFYLFTIITPNPTPSLYEYVFLYVIFFLIGVLVAYICVKTNSILLGIFVQLLLYLVLPFYLLNLELPIYGILNFIMDQDNIWGFPSIWNFVPTIIVTILLTIAVIFQYNKKKNILGRKDLLKLEIFPPQNLNIDSYNALELPEVIDTQLIEPDKHKSWNSKVSVGLSLGAFLFMNFILGVFFVLITYASLNWDTYWELTSNQFFSSVIFLFDLIFIWFPILCVRKYTQNPPLKNRFILWGFTIRGFDRKKLLKGILIGVIFAFVGVLMVLFISFLTEGIIASIFGSVPNRFWGVLSTDISSLIVLSITMILVIGTSEEILFRGFMQKGLIRRLRNKLGIFITAFLFSIIHIIGVLLIPSNSPLVILISFLYSFFPYFSISIYIYIAWFNTSLEK